MLTALLKCDWSQPAGLQSEGHAGGFGNALIKQTPL